MLPHAGLLTPFPYHAPPGATREERPWCDSLKSPVLIKGITVVMNCSGGLTWLFVAGSSQIEKYGVRPGDAIMFPSACWHCSVASNPAHPMFKITYFFGFRLRKMAEVRGFLVRACPNRNP